MKRPKSVLLWVEGLFVALFLLFLVLAVRLWSKETVVEPIDPAALKLGPASKEWFGVYFLDQKVGYAVTSRSSLQSGGTLVQTEAAWVSAREGRIARAVIASSAQLDADGRLKKFDTFVEAHPVRLAARGEVKGKELLIEIDQAGESQILSLDIEEPPHIGASFSAWVAALEDIRVSSKPHRVPYFDPLTLSQKDMLVRVSAVEVLASGEEAYWFERSFSGAKTRSLMLSDGQTLREENSIGLSMVRETPEKARTMPKTGELVDVIALSAVPFDLDLSYARSIRRLRLKVSGVPATQLAHEPPLQVVENDEVTIEVPALEALPPLPLRSSDEALAPYLGRDPFLMIDHREIVEQSRSILAGIEDRKAGVDALNRWVFDALDKVPTVGIPNALEVLRVRQGDCNEHTALFVGLARAAGIPSRVVAGLVYSDRITAEGAFFYHAWPEVFFGEAGWVPVEPTFGQFPADATHVKVVDGGLDKQIEIMSIMGRIALKHVSTD